jgi:membrane protein DedA with SNARE-associated domain
MLGIIVQLHSFIRWILLVLLIAAILKSFQGMRSKRAYTASDNKISLFLLISAHVQLLVGVLLYFISPFVTFTADTMKNDVSRFFTMEHSVMMIIAIALITIGRVASRKAATDEAKFKKAFTFFLIALLVILAGIPWPFMQVAKSAAIGWF